MYWTGMWLGEFKFFLFSEYFTFQSCFVYFLWQIKEHHKFTDTPYRKNITTENVLSDITVYRGQSIQLFAELVKKFIYILSFIDDIYIIHLCNSPKWMISTLYSRFYRKHSIVHWYEFYYTWNNITLKCTANDLYSCIIMKRILLSVLINEL